MSLKLQTSHWEQMLAHVRRESPLEACGLLAGANGISQQCFEIENELRSPIRYRMAPKQQLQAFLAIERKGWDLLAIYHSHPGGPAGPSATDLAEAHYPEAQQLIWSYSGDEWTCRAFCFEEGAVQEVKLELLPAE